MPDRNDIDALIHGLTARQTDVKVTEVLEAALAESLPTEERLRQIEKALETFKGLGLLDGDDPENLHLLLTLGRTYERLSHLEKAFETYENALALAQRHNDAASRARLLGRMGRVLSRWNRWKEALERLEQSRRAYAELGDEKGQARAVVNRGLVFHEQGDYEPAAAAYEEALALAQRAGDGQTVADASNNLAVLATIQGNLEDAIGRYGTCLEMYREAGDHLGTARTYHNLGMTHADRRDWGRAMDAYERGFEIAQKNDHLGVMANIHLSMAEVLLELGNSLMVPLCCARALDIYRKTGDHLGEADTYRLLGRTFAHRREWETAENLFRDSLRLNEEYANPLGVAETHRDLGRMQLDRGLRNEARASLEAALAEFQKLGARAAAAAVELLMESLGDA